MTSSVSPAGLRRRLGALVALLAIAVGLLAPQGFMVASGRSGPTIVICTGHGPATMPGQPDRSDHKGGHAQACAFAGHGIASSPPSLAIIGKVVFAPQTALQVALADLAPGRGLAAPPPPSQGPPNFL
jgi:hypothetical protein